MKFCQTCGKEIMDQAVVCPHCGCSVSTSQGNASSTEDVVNVGLCVLSAFIPLFGLIYWAVKAKETPHRAKACGITGLISWGVSLLLTCLLSTALTSSFLYLLDF